ncbi:ribonucleotide-diphosphate reductase subunit beta [Haliea sp.]|uniref:ribonucleotide-diphosphate reductase subunit beta n=1 Tax=Haliea sp. TaxID=1932666 RepID=UPI000C4096D1|nr:ribonucleotide-diphosphate reductase subunit beta [Haliea sp.]MAD65500.1 ribonucleotide-diphosphate reductase subunit beta [Haliea sp.]
MSKKDITKERIVYKPFEYQDAADYWLKQQQAHWLHTEVPMMSDINDWKQNLTDTEKNIVGSILKGFAQTETVVNDYWSGLVTKWFRKPEIIMMATTFGAFETIHAEAYSLLNEELGLDNFAEFMEDEATMAKIENLMSIRDSFNGEKDWHEIAKSLAIFSAFTEGVNLFSSFAVLLSFKMRNKLKGVGQIVEWSIRDESMHSEAGCWLFRTLIQEKPELKTPELEAAINEAALLSLQLELDFINKAFELGDLEGCSKDDLIHFIKNRVNTKLGDLGYKPIIDNIDMNAVDRMKWFDHLSADKQHTDFFANRVTNYSKGHLEWDESIF